jgi:hypothetical protein
MTLPLPRLGVIALCLTIMGCKADEFEIVVGTDDIAKVAAGTDVSVEFEMVFSSLGDMDDEKRAQIDRFEQIMSSYMNVTEFEIESDDGDYELQIEGTIPVTTDPAPATPYFLHVAPSVDFPGYTSVEVATGATFAAMRAEMQEVDFMMAPDEFHPTRIKLSGAGERLLAPGVSIDGAPFALFVGVVEERMSLNFKGGVYDDTGAVFLVQLP